MSETFRPGTCHVVPSSQATTIWNREETEQRLGHILDLNSYEKIRSIAIEKLTYFRNTCVTSQELNIFCNHVTYSRLQPVQFKYVRTAKTDIRETTGNNTM